MSGLCTIDGQEYYNGPFGQQGSWVGPKIVNQVVDLILPPSSTQCVSLSEVKEELKIIDSNTSEDSYISDLIALCQSHVEVYCGVSLGNRSIQVILNNFEGFIEIPYGPIISITTMTDKNGNDLSANAVYSGILPNGFIQIVAPNSTYINVTYVAGYIANINLPLDLKKAVKQEIAFRYRYRIPDQNIRANVNPGLCSESVIYANPWRRSRFI